MALAKQNTYVAVVKESVQGTIVNPTDSDFILIDEDFDLDTSYEEIERAVITGGLDPLASILGMQDGSCSFTVELKGSGEAHTAPESDAVLRACCEDPTDPLSAGDGAVNTGYTASEFDMTGSPGFAVGDALSVGIDGGAAEYAVVTQCSGTTTQWIKVEPEFSGTPQSSDVVKSAPTYKQKGSGHDSLSVHIFLDCVGQDGLWIKFGGCRPNLTFTNVSTGQIPKMQFTFTPCNWSVQHTGSNLSTLGLAPDVDTETVPPICLSATITLGASRTTIHTQNLELDLGMEVTKRLSMIPTSGVRSSRYTKRQVTGKYDLDLDDDSEYTAWIAQTDSNLLIKFGDTAGNMPVIIVPDCRRAKVAPVDSEGLWISDINWKANPRSTALGPVIFAFF
jgi:hypothetical protein